MVREDSTIHLGLRKLEMRRAGVIKLTAKYSLKTIRARQMDSRVRRRIGLTIAQGFIDTGDYKGNKMLASIGSRSVYCALDETISVKLHMLSVKITCMGRNQLDAYSQRQQCSAEGSAGEPWDSQAPSGPWR